MKKVLKSFSTAHEAVNWVSKNRFEGASIETTSTLKSFGYGRIPSGNYHVIKSRADDASAYVQSNAPSMNSNFAPTLLREIGTLGDSVDELEDSRGADELHDQAVDDNLSHLFEQTARQYGLDHTDPTVISRLKDLAYEGYRRGRKSVYLENIVRETVKSVLKSMGY
jgi:hypothetical protein